MRAYFAATVVLAMIFAGCAAPEPTFEEPVAGHGAAEEHPAAHGTPWSYGGSTGPSSWGSLDSAYARCGSGREQSPIDLTDAVDISFAGLEYDYEKAALRVKNTGHGIQVDLDRRSSARIEGDLYKLLQFHWHSPSEHTIDGVLAPMEMHFVHATDAGDLAVIGVMMTVGAHNPAIQSVWDNMPRIAGTENSADGFIHADDLMPADRQSMWRYAGSLTTPPCTEGLKWHVLTDPIEISQAQLDNFRGVYHGTNRPIQPLYDRTLWT